MRVPVRTQLNLRRLDSDRSLLSKFLPSKRLLVANTTYISCERIMKSPDCLSACPQKKHAYVRLQCMIVPLRGYPVNRG